ncbi:GGDEF domain-containing protein [Mesorhizobium sp.]|uniref:GGDEF domain-containing protein n=1 Tax=Mesorhizobium sp. TaxID=1871066 RepID=UPI0025BA5A24|nr:GGDEF domain-containing protein [Mesorhizobium sp.]
MAATVAHLLKQRRIGFGGQIAVAVILLGIGGHAIEAVLNFAAWVGKYDQQLYFTIESYALVCVIYSGVAWHFGFIVMALNRLHSEMVKVAETDELTNLPNRRYFMGRLTQAEHKFSKDGTPYSVMMIDIDRFKQWNDEYGHAVGDEALIHYAKVASGVVHGSDVLARTGGDEFSLLMPGTEEAEATEVAHGLVPLIRRSSFKCDGQFLSMSVSSGIAARDASDVRADIDVLAHADVALYKVKQAGRDGYATLTTTVVGRDVAAFRVVAGGSDVG